MWFIGSVDENGQSFNMPWYLTPAHSVVNHDRSRRHPYVVRDRQSLRSLTQAKFDKSQYMIVLRPDHQDLFRDTSFLEEVAQEALRHSMPIDLEGSTLAHAYYLLNRLGCTVIASSEKEHSRVRKMCRLENSFETIPARIAARQELERQRPSREVPFNRSLLERCSKKRSRSAKVKPSRKDALNWPTSSKSCARLPHWTA